MGKTGVKPKAQKSRSTGILPFFESAKTAFPDMMRRVTQRARDWITPKKHSEMIKPYLADPDASYPEIDYTWPTPISVEGPNLPGGSWTDTGEGGEEAYKFNCIVHCSHTTKSGLPACYEPVKCWFGAWTVVGKRSENNWKIYAREPYTADSNNVNITGLLDITFDERSAKTTIMPKSGSWDEIVSEYSGGQLTGDDHYIWLEAVYTDTTRKDAKYYDPIQQKWLIILSGRSECSDKTSVRCGICPVDPVMTFDDASTPDTIAPGGEISIYVQGGAAAYSWEVSGTGYTLGSSSTSGVSNTLESAAGVCGVDYDAVVTVTVTDGCDTEVSFTIRNTGGQWTFDSTNCGANASSDGTCYGTIQSSTIRYGLQWKDKGCYPPNVCERCNAGGCCQDAIDNAATYGFSGDSGSCGTYCDPTAGACLNCCKVKTDAVNQICTVNWIWKETYGC